MRDTRDFLAGPPLRSFDVTEQDLRRTTDVVVYDLTRTNAPDPVLFDHCGVPVWLDLHNPKSVFVEITHDRMRHLLAKLFNWYRPNKKGDSKSAYPPLEIARDVLGRAYSR
jgi:hypothetical protein